jgi:hypothetical protein
VERVMPWALLLQPGQRVDDDLAERQRFSTTA